MGKLRTNPDGTHTITGGFSTAKKEDIELLRPIVKRRGDAAQFRIKGEEPKSEKKEKSPKKSKSSKKKK